MGELFTISNKVYGEYVRGNIIHYCYEERIGFVEMNYIVSMLNKKGVEEESKSKIYVLGNRVTMLELVNFWNSQGNNRFKYILE